MILLPYLFSFFIGLLIVKVIFRATKINPSLSFFVSLGLGLAVSAQITFYSYLIFDQLNANFVMAAHGVLLAILIPAVLRFGISFNLKETASMNYKAVIVFVLGLCPLWSVANYYLYGGWDAWSCWNLKSKFLFLGHEHWKNMFNPYLWRESPHYPLLLPLVNVWGWLWTKEAAQQIPMLTSMGFSLGTAGLLYSGLKILTKERIALLALLCILTLPFFMKLSTSQYADIVFAYFLLGSFLCLVLAKLTNAYPYSFLAGSFLGFLSFSKSEGTAAALLVVILGACYLLIQRKHINVVKPQKLLFYFLMGILIFSLPTIFFQLLYAPANQTFTNGLTSSVSAQTYRLKAIAVFFLVEIISEKWNCLWVLLTAGLFLSKTRCFNRTTCIFPLFFILYGLAVYFYYFLNTYFDILWWLSVTLNRILFSILPTVIFWVFYSLWQDKDGLTIKE